MTSDLIIGIASGIIATFLAMLMSHFFKTVVIPFIKSILFDIPNISGQWQSYDLEEGDAVGEAVIKQRNRQIYMQVIRTTDRQKQTTHKVFACTGKFASGTLVGYFEDVDMKGYIIGAIVMRLLPDNKTLKGKTVYFDYHQGEVVTHDYWLKR
ncbi:MAG: hypothetical protein DRR16_33840 [Candidatus Parabeggiatoa sp. nov. 3]|nr:MAG: hypothetical protein DRR00_34405 [Gammaproteobacteria bacterium]RKZ50387.1 MAG: hypothetical protein DRQ99_33900 [Gammaproteobacteria bacterium]RKZ72700.1 MAG: hypothetical protein DRR16_33840 [Gammaproteobacteria bacterium]